MQTVYGQAKITAGISGALLCSRAGGYDRARLSSVERGYLDPSERELARLNAALDELIIARREVATVAAKVGWPMN